MALNRPVTRCWTPEPPSTWLVATAAAQQPGNAGIRRSAQATRNRQLGYRNQLGRWAFTTYLPELVPRLNLGSWRATRTAGRRAHLSNQEAAVGNRKEVVGNTRFHIPGRKQKARVRRFADVEEEDPVLSLEHTQQASATKDRLSRVQMAVVRFIANVASSRNGETTDLTIELPTGRAGRRRPRLNLCRSTPC